MYAYNAQNLPPNTPAATYDRSLVTRKICFIGVAIAWILGIAATITGVALIPIGVHDQGGWVARPCSRLLRQFIPLVINVVVTLVTECTGLVHSTALRWALGHSLTFNSNLRLFTRIPTLNGFGRLANFLNAVLLILSYASSSVIVSILPSEQVCKQAQGQHDCRSDIGGKLIYISPLSIVILGLALGGQAFFATFQVRRVQIPTWSSSPIDNAWALLSTRGRNYGRCLMGVHESSHPTAPTLPKKVQGSAWSAHVEIRRVFIFVWALVVVLIVWCVALFGSIKGVLKACESDDSRSDCGGEAWGNSWSLIPDTNGISAYAQINIVDSPDADFGGYASGFFLTFAIQVALQGMLTMCLHCVELLVTASRDEDTWRKAYSRTGCRSTNAIMSAVTSWKTVVLLASKPLIHWIFGLTVEFYFGYGIFMRPVQLLYMLAAMILIGLFATFLCSQKPRGPQPATFGHLQTLIDLIDVWGQPLFWGDKGPSPYGYELAGTATTATPGKVITDRLYLG